MSLGAEFEPEPPPVPGLPGNSVLTLLAALLNRINVLVLWVSMLALVLTSVVLTYSVLSRYFLKIPTDWQDEASVFMLVGAMFMCGAFVQSTRGHVGIEALAAFLPASVNRIRQIVVDFVSTLFCGFFSWKSWTLFHEAWAEGQTTSSSFAPPLWIPYGLMALGMSLLALQLLLQFSIQVSGREIRKDAK